MHGSEVHVPAAMSAGDQRLRRLSARHHRLDDRLHVLLGRHYLTPSEQIEETTLKKQKLAVKDAMTRLALSGRY